MERAEAERLVRLHGQAVYRLAYARTGSREDAEDVTQETFLRLVRTGPEFQDEEHCRAWLFRVALNCAGDLFRSAWRRRKRPLEEAVAGNPRLASPLKANPRRAAFFSAFRTLPFEQVERRFLALPPLPYRAAAKALTPGMKEKLRRLMK